MNYNYSTHTKGLGTYILYVSHELWFDVYLTSMVFPQMNWREPRELLNQSPLNKRKEIFDATAVLKGREIPYTCTKTNTRYASLTAA